MSSIVSVPACFFQPWYRRPSSLHIKLVHTGPYVLNRSLYPPKTPVVMQLMWFAIGSNVIFLLRGLCNQSSMCLCVFYFLRRFHLEHLGCIFESCHMIDSLSAWSSIISVCTAYFHSDVSFFVFSQLMWSHGATLLVYPLLFSQFSFLAIFIFLGVIAEFLLGCNFLSFLLWEIVGIILGMPPR